VIVYLKYRIDVFRDIRPLAVPRLSSHDSGSGDSHPGKKEALPIDSAVIKKG